MAKPQERLADTAALGKLRKDQLDGVLHPQGAVVAKQDPEQPGCWIPEGPTFCWAEHLIELLQPLGDSVQILTQSSWRSFYTDSEIRAMLPPELASLYEWPLLTKDQEQHQFRLMNFLKHKLSKLKQSVNPSAVRVGETRLIDNVILEGDKP